MCRCQRERAGAKRGSKPPLAGRRGGVDVNLWEGRWEPKGMWQEGRHVWKHKFVVSLWCLHGAKAVLSEGNVSVDGQQRGGSTGTGDYL